MDRYKRLAGKIWRKLPQSARQWIIRVTQKKFTVSVIAIILNSEGKILLLDHVLRPKNGWGAPGGFIDAGEQPVDAIKREICEETGLELSLYRDAMPAASSAALADCLLGRRPDSSNPTIMVHRVLRLQDGLNALDPLDRELLALRHFEQLTREEAARVLCMDEAIAARRYVQALKKLNHLFATTK